MEKTWKPMVAGILDIVSGALGLIVTISLFIGFGVTSGAFGIPGLGDIPAFVPGLILGMAIPSGIIDILALVGGIYAMQRKKWGLALAGSIAAIFASWPLWPLGIAATVFTVMSKNEFE